MYVCSGGVVGGGGVGACRSLGQEVGEGRRNDQKGNSKKVGIVY